MVLFTGLGIVEDSNDKGTGIRGEPYYLYHDLSLYDYVFGGSWVKCEGKLSLKSWGDTLGFWYLGWSWAVKGGF